MGDAGRPGGQRALPGLSRAAALAVVAADAGLAAAGARRARRVSKPAVLPMVALAARRPGGQLAGRPVGLGVALVGSWVGDVALLSRSPQGLLGGIGGFAAAHLGYLAEIRRFARAPVPSTTATAAPAPAGRWAGVVSAAYGGVWAGAAGVLLGTSFLLPSPEPENQAQAAGAR